MNFLNEVASNFPTAVSLAAGRPSNVVLGRLSPSLMIASIGRYMMEESDSLDDEANALHLLQYGRTAGTIHGLIATQLSNDEHIEVQANLTVVTAGCQEAIALCISTLCTQPGEVTLVPNPTYIGVMGAAYAVGVRTVPLIDSRDGIVSSLEASLTTYRAEGLRVKAFYLIPDFDNPTGAVINIENRLAILEICARERVIVIEDNPYGLFQFEGIPAPRMFSLDSAGSVIYLSTYSKSIAPSLRVASLSLPKTIFGDQSVSKAIFSNICERKSFLTVNTNQIGQAIVGGILLNNACSLIKWIDPALSIYRQNRDLMLSQLGLGFSQTRGISWNKPSGGFFIAVDLPFEFGSDQAAECVEKFGVIVMPMSFFAFGSSENHRVRLAFSYEAPDEIQRGTARFCSYVREKIDNEQMLLR